MNYNDFRGVYGLRVTYGANYISYLNGLEDVENKTIDRYPSPIPEPLPEPQDFWQRPDDFDFQNPDEEDE